MDGGEEATIVVVAARWTVWKLIEERARAPRQPDKGRTRARSRTKDERAKRDTDNESGGEELRRNEIPNSTRQRARLTKNIHARAIRNVHIIIIIILFILHDIIFEHVAAAGGWTWVRGRIDPNTLRPKPRGRPSTGGRASVTTVMQR